MYNYFNIYSLSAENRTKPSRVQGGVHCAVITFERSRGGKGIVAMMKILNTVIGFIAALLIIACAWSGDLYGQYILDEETKDKVNEEKPPIDKKKETLPPDIAYNIRATQIAEEGIKCAIKVTWDLNPDYVEEFLVFKASHEISSLAGAKTAQIIQTVKAGTNNAIIDMDCTPGNIYYAVLSRRKFHENKVELFPDVNYTTIPVNIPSSTETFDVSKLRAMVVDGYRVKLTWKRPPKSGIFYTVYRGRFVLDNKPKIKVSERIAVVADAGEFMDDNIPESGTYYYAVTAKVLFGDENMIMRPDENYTTSGITINLGERTADERLKPTSIAASPETGGVRVTWDYAGAKGDTSYSIFRSEKPLSAAIDVTKGDIIAAVDLKAKQYLDVSTRTGSYYYGVIPNDAAERENFKLVPGVSITKEPVRIGEIDKEKDKDKDLGKRNETPDKNRPVVPSGSVDRILKKTFFQNRYNEAIAQLTDFTARTDSESEAAKARYFIGRSHIELGQYRKAVEFLIRKDVRAHYPQEAKFWEEFALGRMRMR